MTRTKKTRGSKKQTKPRIKRTKESTKKTRKSPGQKKVEQIIKESIYRIAERALSSEITENIEIQSVENAKNATLDEVELFIERQIEQTLTELQEKGISKPNDILEQQDTVVDMMNKVQSRMEENAKKLSKK